MSALNAGAIGHVTIIIAAYNGAAHLRDAIDSALAQTFEGVDIVVVDDGSTDDTAAIADSYPDVTLLRQENQGPAAARNRGFEASRGDAVLFLDQDDRLLPGNVETGVRILNAALDCGFVAGRARWISDDPTAEPTVSDVQKRADYATILSGHAFVPPSVVLFRREAFEAAGGFNTDYKGTDDLDLYLNVARLFPVRVHDEIIVEYRRHKDNYSNDTALMLREVLRVLEDHRPHVAGDLTLERALEKGRRHWINLFTPMLPGKAIQQAKHRNLLAAFRTLATGLHHDPAIIAKFVARRLRHRAS